MDLAKTRPLLGMAGVLAVILAGCTAPTMTPAGSGSSTGQPGASATRPSSQQQEVRPPEQTHAAGRGITITWQETAESGGIRKVLEVNADTGALDAVTQSGALKQASGIFYREGKPRAKFAAPEVVASRDKQTVVARGGVTVNSIDPPGVRLSSDQITWHAQKHQIIARGSVKLSHTPKGAKGPIAYGNVPQATANTELQVITVP